MTVHVLGVICPLDQRLNRGNHIHTVDVGGSTIRRVDPELVGCLVDVNATELSTILSFAVCVRVPGNLKQAHVCRRWCARARGRACVNRLFVPLEANEQQCRVQCHVLRVHVRTVRLVPKYMTFRVHKQRCREETPKERKGSNNKTKALISKREKGSCHR